MKLIFMKPASEAPVVLLLRRTLLLYRVERQAISFEPEALVIWGKARISLLILNAVL